MKKKKVRYKKVKTKLTLAFFILFYFDQISFHNLKSYGQKKQKEIKKPLEFNINCFKLFLNQYVFSLIYNQQKNKTKKLLLIKIYLTFLENFNHKLRQKGLDNLKKNKDDFFLYKVESSSFQSYENSSFLIGLKSLEDFLKV